MKINRPPFVTGFALQNYLTAEKGLIEAQLNHYQQWYIDCSLQSEKPSAWSDVRINTLLASIHQYQVTPIIHGNYKIPLAADVEELRATAIDYTKKEITFAAKLNAPLIVHGGAIVEPRLVIKTKKKALDAYLDSLISLKAYADTLGVTLYLENLSNYKNYHPFHYIFTHEDEFSYILESIDLPFFLDLGHANICNGNPLKIFNKFHKRIIALSLSNNNGIHDQHLGLYEGSIDYTHIVSAILDTHWQGVIAFETRGKTPESSIKELCLLYEQIKNASKHH